jgi:hypothetical protein
MASGRYPHYPKKSTKMLNASKRKKGAGFHTKLKAPPYSKPITRARRAGLVPRHLGLGHVIIALEWRAAYLELFPYVVLPPDEDPAGFDWSFCAGLDICIVCTDTHPVYRQKLLAKSLFSANIANLRILNIDGIANRRDDAWQKIIQLFKGHPSWENTLAFKGHYAFNGDPVWGLNHG